MSDTEPGSGSAAEPAPELAAESPPEPAVEPASDETPATPAKFYQRPMSRAWLIGLAIVALLVGLVGYSLLQRSGSQNGDESASGGAVPTVSGEAPSPPSGLALAPVSVTRHGDQITLVGNLPDPEAKRLLLDAVVTSVEDVNVMDNLGVTPGVKALDFAGSGPVFEAAAAIPDFSLNVSGDTVTLGGTAATADESDAVQDAAEDAWPGVNIANTMEISSLVTPGGGRPG